MSRLQELIAELCPDGVEYKALGELLDYEQPGKYIVASTDYNDEYSVPVLTAGKGLLLGYTDETEGVYVASDDDPVIIFDDFTTSFHWITYNFKVKSSAMKMLRPTPDCSYCMFRYAYYAMKNIDYAPESHTRQWIGTYSAFRIPVPPLEVQREVVRILDEYTAAHDELVKQLKEERETLGTQLNLLQEQLFASGAYECKQLGDVAHTFVGLATSVTKWKRPSGIRLLHNSDIQPNRIVIKNDEFIAPEFAERNKAKRLLVGDVITVHTGAVGTSSVINEEYDGALGFTTLTARILDKDELSPSYLCHVLNSDYCLAQIAKMSISDRNNLNQKSYNRILIPMPPIEEQMRIVLLLDDGLECFRELSALVDEELSLCDQQLSLVRNQLLSFPEKVA